MKRKKYKYTTAIKIRQKIYYVRKRDVGRGTLVDDVDR